LLGCLLAERRVLTGLAVLAVVAVVITLARLLGLVLDGAAPFTLFVLRPELALIVASATALTLERRRRNASGGGRILEGWQQAQPLEQPTGRT
jgi:hypothetical protein